LPTWRPGRTLTDLARFELEAESLVDHEDFVVSSDALAARRLAARQFLQLRMNDHDIGDDNGSWGHHPRACHAVA
jgi:hypothetical protein